MRLLKRSIFVSKLCCLLFQYSARNLVGSCFKLRYAISVTYYITIARELKMLVGKSEIENTPVVFYILTPAAVARKLRISTKLTEIFERSCVTESARGVKFHVHDTLMNNFAGTNIPLKFNFNWFCIFFEWPHWFSSCSALISFTGLNNESTRCPLQRSAASVVCHFMNELKISDSGFNFYLLNDNLAFFHLGSVKIRFFVLYFHSHL